MWIGHQRFIYNAKVKEADYWFRFSNNSLALTGLRPLPDQAYSQFIGKDSAFLRDVPSQVLRNGAYRFMTGTSRALKGLGGFPVVKKKHGRQSALLTSELFRVTRQDGQLTLSLGTKSKPLGLLKFKQHREVPIAPKMISISVEPDGRWFVSFCAERPRLAHEPDILRTPEELAYELSLLDQERLDELVVGIDRGVAVPLATSKGLMARIPEVSLARIERKERHAKRLQRRMARQQKGSQNRNKTRRKLARLKGYGADVRKEFAHQVSHQLVRGPAQVFAFEDLKLKNMTASPAPKVDDKGRYTSNGAAAKAGLNKALLSSALGLVKQYVGYKAAWRNKLVLSVPAAYSSQTCSQCGHRSPDNRLSQSKFECRACGHRANADTNASEVIKLRAISQLITGVPTKKKITTKFHRGKQEVRNEPLAKMPVESVLVTGYDSVVVGAVLPEAGNRYLGALASGSR